MKEIAASQNSLFIQETNANPKLLLTSLEHSTAQGSWTICFFSCFSCASASTYLSEMEKNNVLGKGDSLTQDFGESDTDRLPLEQLKAGLKHCGNGFGY